MNIDLTEADLNWILAGLEKLQGTGTSADARERVLLRRKLWHALTRLCNTPAGGNPVIQIEHGDKDNA